MGIIKKNLIFFFIRVDGIGGPFVVQNDISLKMSKIIYIADFKVLKKSLQNMFLFHFFSCENNIFKTRHFFCEINGRKNNQKEAQTSIKGIPLPNFIMRWQIQIIMKISAGKKMNYINCQKLKCTSSLNFFLLNILI